VYVLKVGFREVWGTDVEFLMRLSGGQTD